MRPAGRCAYADDHRRRVDQRATATGQTSRSAQPKRGAKRAFADGSVTGDGEDPETERIEAKINGVRIERREHGRDGLSLESTNDFDWDLAAPDGTVLKPTTTYALVFQGDAGAYPELWAFALDGENQPAEGWSLANALLYHDGSNWVENPDGRSLAIDMIGPRMETEEPALVSATVGAAGNAVALVFDENVDLPSNNADARTFLASLASAFAVTADAVGVPVSGLTAWATRAFAGFAARGALRNQRRKPQKPNRKTNMLTKAA